MASLESHIADVLGPWNNYEELRTENSRAPAAI
jgi:hypothetical protein